MSDQDAAVAAEDDGERSVVQESLQPLGESPRVPCDRFFVPHACTRFPLRVVPGRHHDSAFACPESVEEAVVPKRPGKLVDPGYGALRRRTQPEVRGSIEEDEVTVLHRRLRKW
jgi:hypothetical protein